MTFLQSKYSNICTSLKNRVIKSVLFFSLAVWIGSDSLFSNAYAMPPRIYLLGAFDFAGETTGSSSLFGFPGGGLGLEFRMGRQFSLDFGGIYVARRLEGNAIYTYHNIQGSLTFRLWLMRFLAVGLGGYYAHGLGSISVDTASGSQSESYSSLSRTANDYGLLGSVGLNFPLGPGVALYLEGRYLFGLANLSLDGSIIHARDIQGVFGFRIGR